MQELVLGDDAPAPLPLESEQEQPALEAHPPV
jgi:hypothetical protein